MFFYGEKTPVYYYFLLLFSGLHLYINFQCRNEVQMNKKNTYFHVLILILSCFTYFYGSIYTSCTFYTLYTIIVLVLSYYAVDLFYKFSNGNYDYFLHHLCSLIVFNNLIHNEHYKIVIEIFFWSAITTPLLSLSKVLHKLNYKISAKICFVTFSIGFFITRVCAATYLLYQLFLILETPFLKSAATTLYLLQLYWFTQIVNFFKKNIL